MSLSKLINNGNWGDIIKKIEKNKVNVNEEVMEGNYLIHYAGLSNNIRALKKILGKGGDMAEQNSLGETVAHISAKLGYYNILKYLVKKNPYILNKVSNDGDTVLHILYDNYEMLDYIFKKYEKYINSLNKVNKKGFNVLLKNIRLGKDNKIIKLLIKNGVNLNCPNEHPPIMSAVDSNNFDIVKLLVKNGANVNAKDKTYVNAFILSVLNRRSDIAKYLLQNGADSLYSGGESDHNPLVIAINNKDYDMLKVLLDDKEINPKLDFDSFNRYLDIPAHYIFMKVDKTLPMKVKKKILRKTNDLNRKNINGNTVLHYLLHNDDWKKYKDVLIGKKLDITIKNKKGKTPVDFLKGKKKDEFLDFINSSYVRNLKKKGDLMKRSNSTLKKNKQENSVILKQVEDVNKSSFSSSTIFNIIYTLGILQKYSNLTIPFINNPTTPFGMKNNLYKVVKNKSIFGVINIYAQVLYELVPYIILWSDKNNYFISKDLKLAFKFANNRKNKRFILLRLSLVVNKNMNHANILLYDKVENTIERFDPYGNIPYGNPDEMDDFLEEKLKSIINDKLVYLRPSDYMDKVSFQIISNEDDKKNKKFGDPMGFCLAWIYWYVEMRIMNENVKPKILVSKLIKKINDSKYTFMEYIRNYADVLDKEKNMLLRRGGINEKNFYNDTYTVEDINKIINQMVKEFDGIIYKSVHQSSS